MLLRQQGRLTFQRIAEEWAKQPHTMREDEILDQLFSAYWQGEFDDDVVIMMEFVMGPNLALRGPGQMIEEDHRKGRWPRKSMLARLGDRQLWPAMFGLVHPAADEETYGRLAGLPSEHWREVPEAFWTLARLDLEGHIRALGDCAGI